MVRIEDGPFLRLHRVRRTGTDHGVQSRARGLAGARAEAGLVVVSKESESGGGGGKGGKGGKGGRDQGAEGVGAWWGVLRVDPSVDS